MSISNLRQRRSIKRMALNGAALGLLAMLAAGCSTTGTMNVSDYDHHRRHPIMLSEEPEVLDIPVGMNGPAMSRQVAAAVADYAGEYRQYGTGIITIQVPVASANEFAAGATGRAVHYALVQAGVPHGQIEVAPYHVGDHSRPAGVRLTYLRVKAVAPQCGLWPELAPNNNYNPQPHNFGCASQQNLAAMVANPADFIWPQPLTPANGARRAKVITDYSQGAETRSDTTLISSDLGG
jgi:pilus assembly protein CpaD